MGEPVVGRNADGHLEVFKVDSQGEMCHRWQKETDGDWSAWSSLGGALLPGLAVANSADGRIELFAVDRQSRALRSIVQELPNSRKWSDWTNLGGEFSAPVTVGQDLDGRLEVFAVEMGSGKVRHCWQTNTSGGWSDWAQLGGALEPGLVIARNHDGRLEVFGVDQASHDLVHAWQSHPSQPEEWSAWESLGGSVWPGLAVGRSGDGRLEVFAVNRTNNVVNRVCQASPGSSRSWSPWHDFGVGERVLPGLAVGQSADGRLEIFAVDLTNATLLHRFEITPAGSDNWSGWVVRGESVLACPAVGQNEDGNLELFAIEAQDATTLKHRRQISGNSDWLDWLSLDRPTFRYSSRMWQVGDGLPHNLVRAIAQTRDGYLWVGTPAGLARFDGLEFTTLDARNTPELTNSSITALCTDHQGALWIGTDGGGLVRLSDGVFSRFGQSNGLAGDHLRVICEGKDGTLWIGTTTGMSRYRDGRFRNYTRKEGLLSDVVTYIYEDRNDDLWISTGGGLNRLRKGGTLDAFEMPNGLPNDSVRAICQDKGGRIWIGSNNGMLWYNWHKSGHFYAYHFGLSALEEDDWHEAERGDFYAYNTRYGLSDTFVSTMCEDRDGNLWVGTYSGLNRFREGRFFNEQNNEGMPFDHVNALFEDRQGDLWVGSKEGLARLTPRHFSTLAKPQGLTHNDVRSVMEDRAGEIWVGTWGGGLDRVKDEQASAFPITNVFSRDLILSTCEGRDGSLWIGEDFDGGLTRIKEGQVSHYTWRDGLIKDAVQVICEDRSGRVWAGTRSGLSCWREGGFVQFAFEGRLDGKSILAIRQSADGAMWFGTDNGLARWQEGHFTRFTTAEGLSDNTVTALYEDAEHSLWIGTTAGGLNRYRDGRFSSCTTQKGLFSDEIFEILEDDQGWLWMSCSKGVFRVRKAALNALMDGVAERVASSVYGRADGMESTQCNGAGKPAGWKSRDGRLWFPTSKGLAVVDPKTARMNSQPPPTFIEQVLVDRKLVQVPSAKVQTARDNGAGGSGAWLRELAPGSSGMEPLALVLPPGRGELEFHYTALDLRRPERCAFKYRLEGVDVDWIDAGTRRVAHYNNVYPGTYRFQVRACNPDGIWNDTGAGLRLDLRPHFWQTWWWRGSAVILVLGAVGGTARYVTKKRMQRKLERLEQRHAIEKERGRIAKDMHDQLGAGLTQVGLLGELTRRDARQPEQTESHAGELCGVVRELAQTLDEIVWTVNPKNDTLNKLAAYIAVYAEDFFRAADVRCRLDIPLGLPSYPLSAEVRHELFLTVKEALNNVVKHSGASEVWLRFRLEEARLEISVEDNGRGFSPQAVDAFGNGLTGMKERIEGIGGSFAITSGANQGTRIQLAIPLHGVTSPSSAVRAAR